MTFTRCWAFGPDMRRCDLVGGHEDDHQVVTSWTDEESLTFAGGKAVVEVPIHDSVLVDQAVQTLDAPVLCFSCGCDKAAHEAVGGDGEAMCERHQCRMFLA